MNDAPTPGPADLAAVLAAFDPLRGVDARLGRWAGGDEVEPGVMRMPWFDYSPQVRAWERALYDHGILCPVGEDGWADRFTAIVDAPALLTAADLQAVRMVLTTVVRGERFCEGNIAAMFEAGVVQAAMERLRELA